MECLLRQDERIIWGNALESVDHTYSHGSPLEKNSADWALLRKLGEFTRAWQRFRMSLDLACVDTRTSMLQTEPN